MRRARRLLLRGVERGVLLRARRVRRLQQRRLLLAPRALEVVERAREALGKPGAKRDAIMREQLPAWFAAIQQLPTPAVVAYLQVLGRLTDAAHKQAAAAGK